LVDRDLLGVGCSPIHLHAGIDLVSACDIRYTTKEAFFQIKEVDIGLAADVGTLQRMPKVVGNESLMRELAYTARKFTADEANRLGFVSEVYADKDELVEKAVETAALIASKSPVAIFGTKRNLNFSRDHTVQDGLLYAATWSMSMLQTNDLMSSAQAMLTKTKPEFDKL
jgi:delta(3,5)-delta(2,4)-dienoyl-CoA isomerase